MVKVSGARKLIFPEGSWEFEKKIQSFNFVFWVGCGCCCLALEKIVWLPFNLSEVFFFSYLRRSKLSPAPSKFKYKLNWTVTNSLFFSAVRRFADPCMRARDPKILKTKICDRHVYFSSPSFEIFFNFFSASPLPFCLQDTKLLGWFPRHEIWQKKPLYILTYRIFAGLKYKHKKMYRDQVKLRVYI